jgi:hypothetical protein
MVRRCQAITKKTEEDGGSGRSDSGDKKSRKKMHGNRALLHQIQIVRFRPLSGRRRHRRPGRQLRITLTLQITEHEILLFKIGSHDEVYG